MITLNEQGSAERARWWVKLAKNIAEKALAEDRRSAYRYAARKVRGIAQGPLKGVPEIAELADMLHKKAVRAA